METVSSSDAKREFGEIILKAQLAPVGINKNGKPVAVMLSATAYAEIEVLRAKLLKYEIDLGIADIHAGRVLDGETVMQGLRNHVDDADG